MKTKRKIYTIIIIVIFILCLFSIHKKIVNSKNNINNAEITTKTEVDNENIYFFSHIGCPFCEQALKYIDKEYGDTIKIEVIIIDKDKKNFDLFIKASEKYNLDKRKLGTPLIAMGKNYILGWGQAGQEKFDEYVKEFKK